MGKTQRVPAIAGDRFLVRYDAEPEGRTSPGGIVIPDSVKESAIHGTITATVIARGPGRMLEDGTFRPSVVCDVGGRVLLDSVHDAWWIDDPERPGRKLHIVTAVDVLGVVG